MTKNWMKIKKIQNFIISYLTILYFDGYQIVLENGQDLD